MAVYQRGKNWYIDFTFHGQRIREMIGPSRKGAEKVISKKKAEIAENKFLDVRKEPDPIKFYDFAKEYLQWAKANKKPSTLERDLSFMRKLNAEFEGKTIQEITSWQIEKFKAKRRGQLKRPGAKLGSYQEPGKDGTVKEIWFVDYQNHDGKNLRKPFEARSDAETFLQKSQSELKPATVNREMALLKHMYAKAVEWGKVKENPAKKVKRLQGEAKRLRFLVPEEIQTLLSNCSGYLRSVVLVALNTGMRRGELLGLKWGQINMDQGIITLPETKNHEPRNIPMNATVRGVLQDLKKKEGYVFFDTMGKGIFYVNKLFRCAVRKSGITDFRFHDLRHTFASNLVMEGVDIMTVKELMGHKTLEMTLRYAHLAPSHKTKAINVLDRVMSLNPPQATDAQTVIAINI
jgi:integrase